MSSSKQPRTIRKHNKRSVREVCEALGYGSSEKNSARYWKNFSQKTADFRLCAIQNHLQNDSTLHTEAPGLQDLASSFLDFNHLLFMTPKQPQPFVCPVLPDDREQILDELRDLMAIQEANYRRNSARDRGIEDTGHIERSESESAQAQSQIDIETDLVHSPVNVGEAIQKHLNAVFTKESCDWVIARDWFINKTKNIPDDVKAFVWRYAHERDLYSSNNGNEKEFRGLLSTIKTLFKLQRIDSQQCLELLEKCENLIVSEVPGWKRCGLLVETAGNLAKSPDFEAAWRAAHSIYIERPYGERTRKLPEINTIIDLTSDSPSPTSQPPDAQTELADVQIPRSAKRQREETGYPEPQKMAKVEADLLDEIDPCDDPFSDSYVPFRAPQAKMVSSPEQAGQDPVVGIHLQCEAELGNHGEEPSLISVPESEKVSVLPESQSALPPPSNPPEETYGFTLSPVLKANNLGCRPLPLHLTDSSTLSSSSYDLKPPRSTKLLQALNGSFDMKPKMTKPKLEFILEDVDGIPDRSPASIVDSTAFKASTHAFFFQLACDRHGISTESVESISLICNWGNKHSFIIRNDDTEEKWNTLKERVEKKFRWDRKNVKLQHMKVWHIESQINFLDWSSSGVESMDETDDDLK